MCAFIGWMIPAITLQAQDAPSWSAFPGLPDPEGMAGMFAGESGGRLFCMGGANFPDKKPWEGGTKVWYDVIFGLREDGTWERMPQTLPARMAYGVSAAYGDELILVGGSNDIGRNFDRESGCMMTVMAVLEALLIAPEPLFNPLRRLDDGLVGVMGHPVGLKGHAGRQVQSAICPKTGSFPLHGHMTLKAAVEEFVHGGRYSIHDLPTQRITDVEILTRDSERHSPLQRCGGPEQFRKRPMSHTQR